MWDLDALKVSLSYLAYLDWVNGIEGWFLD